MEEEINDEGFEDIITIRNLEKQLAEANEIVLFLRHNNIAKRGTRFALVEDYIKKHNIK